MRGVAGEEKERERVSERERKGEQRIKSSRVKTAKLETTVGSQTIISPSPFSLLHSLTSK